MPTIALPWVNQDLSIELPANWTVQQTARSQLRPGQEAWPDRLAGALNKPDTALPLARLLSARPNGRIVLVIEDITRHSPVPRILEKVMREIRHAKIADEQVGVVFANGMHPPATIVHHCPAESGRTVFSRLEKKIQKSLCVLLPICYKVLCDTKCIGQERRFSGICRSLSGLLHRTTQSRPGDRIKENSRWMRTKLLRISR